MTQRYQVIARRWRPKNFDELVGQEHVVRTLRNAMQMNRIAHAYLFVGPRGTGKTSTARLFAKALNTEGDEKLNSEQRENLAQSIMAGSCMDVIEIDGASNNSVDQIRNLREDCQYAPTQCKYKIYIIDEVHMLSIAAFNALLKTLEEPPAHVIFIFATTEASKVLPTVVSRCQRFEFRAISEKVIASKLKVIAQSEGIQVDEAALYAIARLANGGMRDAQSILDQLISFCGMRITEENILDVYGLASSKSLQVMVKNMAEADYAAVTKQIEVWIEQGRDLYRVLLDLQSLVREGFLQATRTPQRQSDYLGAPLSAESLFRMLDALQAGETILRNGLSEQVNFEITLFRAIEQSRTKAIDTVIKKLTHVVCNLPQEEQIQKKNIVNVVDVEKNKVTAKDIDHANFVGREDYVASSITDLGSGFEARPTVRIHVHESFGGSSVNAENSRKSGMIGVPESLIHASVEKNLEEANLSKDLEFQKALEAIPEHTRQILESEFRAQFIGIRKIEPENFI